MSMASHKKMTGHRHTPNHLCYSKSKINKNLSHESAMGKTHYRQYYVTRKYQ